ncbi:hypothetical protein [Bosea vestrisii]|uniref:Plasmid segregation centromere-binding protein ParG n=1 Tax=Bosea vestrisii TaxID=151416 RepID=A0ABW0HDJ7_9HYPH
MSAGSGKRGFAARPSSPDAWIKAPEGQPNRAADASTFTARLTIDVTPGLRGQIKIAAFQRGQTVAEMLRDLLAREFSQAPGDPS